MAAFARLLDTLKQSQTNAESQHVIEALSSCPLKHLRSDGFRSSRVSSWVGAMGPMYMAVVPGTKARRQLAPQERVSVSLTAHGVQVAVLDMCVGA